MQSSCPRPEGNARKARDFWQPNPPGSFPARRCSQGNFSLPSLFLTLGSPVFTSLPQGKPWVWLDYLLHLLFEHPLHMYICMRRYGCMHICVCYCVCSPLCGGQGSIVEGPSSGVSHLCFETGSPTETWGSSIKLDWLARALQKSCLCLPSTRITGICHYTQLFMWVLGI